ncbi:MAG TPA: bifunctional enoyl-CoA hydratase/phosphate acetyltransferase [Firmicutes bacterium]|nr:bifunctional enoyl-CoA hydratase/phosphate acetyltransferase [Candidatus Fermentithermobacillaceae bacterium]
MSRLFQAFLEKVKGMGQVGVSLVEAFDEEALLALAEAERQGFVSPYLVGDPEKIEKAMRSSGARLENPTVVEAYTPEDSARAGIRLVREGKCAILMKGKIGTGTLMKAVLDREEGLRTGRILSHVACLEVPGYDRFIFVTDGGVVLHPDLPKKVEIVKNAIGVARLMGVEIPRVAVLAPSEVPNPDSEASMHAVELARMSREGMFEGAFVEGPMALDGAVSPEAARIKGMSGEVPGRADILLAPDVVSGNSIAKSMQYFARAVMGGVIVGAKAPIVVISRADTAQVKLNSLAMARALV